MTVAKNYCTQASLCPINTSRQLLMGSSLLYAEHCVQSVCPVLSDHCTLFIFHANSKTIVAYSWHGTGEVRSGAPGVRFELLDGRVGQIAVAVQPPNPTTVHDRAFPVAAARAMHGTVCH